ncbi:MAG: extracellular solute-binding protein, partial [Clostridia bacterium]|nr:extracellular solute-binding protein [Clostridia bacterium]
MKKPKCLTVLSRRLGAAVLTAVMVVGLSACASSEPKPNTDDPNEVSTGTQNTTQNTADTSDQKVTLNLWDAWPGDPQKTIMDDIVREWNDKNPNIQVVRSTTANDPYKTKIKTAVAADEAPDVYFSWPQGFTKPFVDAGKVLAIDDYITDDIKAQILPGAYVEFDGKTYGVCCTQQVGTFFVNTKILSDNGLSVPKTFDDLISVSKALVAKNIIPLSVGEKDLWPGMWYYNQIALREAGPDAVVDALNKKGSFNTEPFIKAADKLKQLVDIGAFDPNALGTSRDESEAAFFSGKMAMYYGLNASGGRIKGSAVEGQIEVHPFPTIS